MKPGVGDPAGVIASLPSEKSHALVHIVFFATQLYPLAVGKKTGFGGAETEMWSLARAFSADPDFDVRVLTLAPGPNDTPILSNPSVYAVTPPRTLTYQDPWIKRRIAIAKYYYTLFRCLLRQHPNVYYAKLASGEAFIVWLASRVIGAKFVFRIEHDWETNLPDLIHHIFRGRTLPARLFIHCLKKADLVIVQTNRQGAALKANFGINTTLIPNGHFIPDAKEIEARPAARKTVLWVGRAHPMKRPHLFLDLATRFPQWKFAMVMSPEPNHQELFHTIQQQASVLPNLSLIPGVAASEVDDLYRSARMFVLTSEAEGFSNVVLEAMKNGSPVITYDHNPNGILNEPESPQALTPAAGYCVSNDLNLAEAITNKLLHDDAFWQSCHATLPKTVAPFTIDIILAAYRERFLSLTKDVS